MWGGGGERSQRLAENSERSTRPCVKGGQENRRNQSGAVHASLDTLRSYLLPTEVESAMASYYGSGAS